MTIGYGNTGPSDCWAAAWVLIAQSVTALLLEAIVLGLVFARISHPHQRALTCRPIRSVPRHGPAWVQRCSAAIRCGSTSGCT